MPYPKITNREFRKFTSIRRAFPSETFVVFENFDDEDFPGYWVRYVHAIQPLEISLHFSMRELHEVIRCHFRDNFADVMQERQAVEAIREAVANLAGADEPRRRDIERVAIQRARDLVYSRNYATKSVLYDVVRCSEAPTWVVDNGGFSEGGPQ